MTTVGELSSDFSRVKSKAEKRNRFQAALTSDLGIRMLLLVVLLQKACDEE